MVADLLELAEHLALRDPGKPKQVSLRRSISTAYYALFHALASDCADKLIGWAKPWSVFKPIYRSLDHNSAKKVFAHASVAARFGTEVDTIGKIFILLQEARHLADYDPEVVYGRQQTLDFVAQARQAVEVLNKLPGDTRLLLAVNLIAKVR